MNKHEIEIKLLAYKIKLTKLQLENNLLEQIKAVTRLIEIEKRVLKRNKQGVL